MVLHRSHPHAPVLEVLDLVVRQLVGRSADLGKLHPCSTFDKMVAEAFDRGMAPMDRKLAIHPNAAPAGVQLLIGICEGEVLPAFAMRYGLEV